MLGIWAFTSFLSIQVSQLFSPVTLATSLPQLALPNDGPSTLPPRSQQGTNLALVNPASSSATSLTAPNNDVSVHFHNEGTAIPPNELLTTLSAAMGAVRAYLPESASYPISNVFEKNVSFPETTGDSVSVTVHDYHQWLSWLQLSKALMLVEEYMLGTSRLEHPIAHSHTLDFYIQLENLGGEWINVAHGVVNFVAGHGAVGKRSLLINPALQLANVNSSSPSLSAPTLPIIFHVAVNLDINITSLGAHIPPSTILTTIEAAYSDVILTHEDIDAPIPYDEPYSFNKTFGPKTDPVHAKIEVSAYRGKEITWGLLYLVLYGLRKCVQEMGLYYVLGFEIDDTRLGRLGRGEVEYRPGFGLASVER
ncbi:hypothetical protein BDR22DRAFT_906442 [Usnea florida]